MAPFAPDTMLHCGSYARCNARASRWNVAEFGSRHRDASRAPINQTLHSAPR
jgi:hypothetical protein